MKENEVQWGREVEFQGERGTIDECMVSDIGLITVLALFLIFNL